MKKIVFFNTSTGEEPSKDRDLFLLDGVVYENNYRICESQAAAVGFDDFIQERKELDWKVVYMT